MPRICITVSEELLAKLDELAECVGAPRSTVIREILAQIVDDLIASHCAESTPASE